LRGLVDGFPWKADLKGKGVQEGLTFFKKGILKGAGAGRPHGPKDEPVGKKISWAEWRALTRTQEKKRKFMTFGRRSRQLRS